MSIMIIYGNNKNASIMTDCRSTCINRNTKEVSYYEDTCKVHKYNKTLIGIIGDGKYGNKIYESIEKDPIFEDKKSLIDANFETLYSLCVKHSRQQKHNFSKIGCMIAMAGINKNNYIVLDYFNTIDFVPHTMILDDSTYATKAFCNYDEQSLDQKVYNLVNTTEEKLISFELHNMIIEDVLPNFEGINEKYCLESISLQ